MKPGRETVEALVALPDAAAAAIVGALAEAALAHLYGDWPAWVHAGQEVPESGDWRVCLMFGGRGFGKTRAGAEWVSQLARDHPGAQIALVAANLGEARRVMVEGPSGLLAVARPGEELLWEPSLRRLEFESGAVAFVYSGADGDSLRGAQHHFAWCDELAKWKEARDAWNNLMLGLRTGAAPRVLVTTTPRSIAALRAIVGEAGVARAGGPSAANPHVAPLWLEAMERAHGGTRLGRQELEGELIVDLAGALWERAMIEERRVSEMGTATSAQGGDGSGESGRKSDCPLVRVVVGVDPPASVDGVCGIVVCGTDEAGTGYVLADLSAGGLAPEGWARKVAAAAQAWGAERVVAEANNGGAMVEAVLKGANVGLPVKLVHAAEGKVARAAPVGTLFESGRAWFAGRFPALEDELAGLTWDGRYHGPGSSPDRADAMVWAMTELMLGAPPRMVRIRRL
ncbi:MAG TPA: terminase family protein [Allosphingosinicella sp.]|nr:terminase family protein [Allosphingosinicella sp.]